MSIRELIQRIAAAEKGLGILCTVKDINESERTCTASPIDGSADILEVRLQSTNAGGIYLKPVVGSVVLVEMANDTLGFVVLTSELEEVIFFDGSLGGIVKINDLVSKLNNLENKVNQLITWGLTVSPPFSPSTLLTLTQVSDLENDKVKHGV